MMQFATICFSLIGSAYSLYKVNRNQDYLHNYGDSLKHNLKVKSSGCATTDGPTYHNGPILTGNVGLYNIYIGYSDADYKTPYKASKATSTAGIVEAFAIGVGGSGYANILQTYTKSGQHAASLVDVR